MDNLKEFRFFFPFLDHILIDGVPIFNLIVYLILRFSILLFYLHVGLRRFIFENLILSNRLFILLIKFSWLGDYDEWTHAIDFVGIKICDQAIFFSLYAVEERKYAMIKLELNNFVCAKNNIYNKSFVEWIFRLRVIL